MAEIGDLVIKSGNYTNPGIVTQKNSDGTVVVDTEPLMISRYHRYSNTTGLTQSEKVEFNEILDRIYTKEDDLEKLNDIQKAIDQKKADPTASKVVQYLKNQQSILIRRAGRLPRYYSWDENQLKT